MIRSPKGFRGITLLGLYPGCEERVGGIGDPGGQAASSAQV